MMLSLQPLAVNCCPTFFMTIEDYYLFPIDEAVQEENIDHYRRILDAYRRGDRIGAPWEGSTLGPHELTYEQIVSRQGRSTDETDIVRCFLKFKEHYIFTNVEQLLLDWCVFHCQKHKCKGYGKTYTDHFRLMAWLEKKGKITLETIRRIASDRNSFGNCCLSLVYPVHRYAKEIGLPPWELVEAFTTLVYTHPFAFGAVKLLSDVVEMAEEGGDLFTVRTDDPYAQDFLTEGIKLSPSEFIRKYPDNVIALHTLFYALYGAFEARSEREVIVKTVNLGGDVDSVLATALMIRELALPQ
jgi:hypothetical protein